MPKTQFAPATNGYRFANYFVNVIAKVPGVGTVQTAGRCGGMAFSALDHYGAGLTLPQFRPVDLGKTGVPPDGHPLADYIYRRQLDSFFVLSAAKFVTWSLAPDDSNFLTKGVARATSEDEFAKLRASIDRGTPVPLGLIVARDLSGLGRNHQVVAYGYDVDAAAQQYTVHIYDVNWPDHELTLTWGKDDAGWVESSPGKERWRGWFVQDFVARRPPPDLTRPIVQVVVERALEVMADAKAARVHARVHALEVTFERLSFENPGDPEAASPLSLEFAVNGRVLRWPARKARRVKHGLAAKVDRSMTVRLRAPDDLVISGAVAGAAALPEGAPDVLAGSFHRRFTAEEGWGRGRHTARSSGDAGTYTVEFSIAPQRKPKKKPARTAR